MHMSFRLHGNMLSSRSCRHSTQRVPTEVCFSFLLPPSIRPLLPSFVHPFIISSLNHAIIPLLLLSFVLIPHPHAPRISISPFFWFSSRCMTLCPPHISISPVSPPILEFLPYCLFCSSHGDHHHFSYNVLSSFPMLRPNSLSSCCLPMLFFLGFNGSVSQPGSSVRRWSLKYSAARCDDSSVKGRNVERREGGKDLGVLKC